MHIKFLDRGQGSARSALEYVLQKYDHNKKERESIEVIRGNPEQVTAVADSLEFKHRYRSAVIAWHPDDKPTMEQMQEVMDDFERVAFAGLEPNQYCYYAVVHDSNHIHVIVPRVELQSGKSLNIAPPGWQNTYDLVRDKFNEKYNWARPDDLSRSRVVNQSINIHGKLTHKEAKRELNKAVMEAIEEGVITNAKEVEEYLNDIEGVTVKPRRSKKSLSVMVDGINKPIRLEGLAYGREFSVRELVKELGEEKEQRDRRSKEDRAREVIRIERELERVIEGRAEYNRGRYEQQNEKISGEAHTVTKEDHRGGEEFNQRDKSSKSRDRRRDRGNESITHEDQNKAVAYANSNSYGSFVWSSVGKLRLSPVHQHRTPNPKRNRTTDDRSKEEQREDGKLSSDSKDVQRRDRVEEEARRVAKRQRELDGAIRKSEKEINDRIRKRVEADIETTRRSVQEGINQHHNDIQKSVAENSERLSGADRGSKQYHTEAEPNIKRIRESKQEYKDTLRRQSGDSLNEASRGLEKPIERARSRVQQFGDKVREFRELVERVGEKIVVMAKKILSMLDGKKEKSKGNTRTLFKR
jgi:F0F1-type ATP synthase membrane subunit b/b'